MLLDIGMSRCIGRPLFSCVGKTMNASVGTLREIFKEYGGDAAN